MKSFKEMIAEDVKGIFLNVEEFSDMHMVNGVEMPVQVDEIEQI